MSQEVEHRVYQYFDDTEDDRQGFCSVIDGAGRCHQVDVMQTHYGDFRWRLFTRQKIADEFIDSLVDSDLEPSMNGACAQAFKAYVELIQQF